MRPRHAALPIALALVAGVATACGGSGTNSTTPAASPTTGAASRPVISAADRAKIQQCLTAAGISVPQPPGGGTRPSGARPSGAPRPGFTPGANGGGGGGAGLFQNPQAQQALKACGITLPQRPATPPAS
ncbi:MAG: hypothetical protein QOF18_2004 [Frankiaceae bacterium]|nr:hypothetical protein [Frankiaceae bacterium]